MKFHELYKEIDRVMTSFNASVFFSADIVKIDFDAHGDEPPMVDIALTCLEEMDAKKKQ